MTRRFLTFCAALTVLAAACSAPEIVPVDYGEGLRFVPAVADSLDDVGEGASIAVSTEGTSYISYFGFPAEVGEGEIAIPRPIGSAFLPGVLLTSVASDGLITKGAVQQTKPEQGEPPNIKVPFRPQTVEGLDLTRENANGTAVAVADDGTVHVAWTAGSTVNYAKVAPNTDAAVSTVYESDIAISQSGPLGRPAITLDDNGAPWIAFGANDAGGAREVVATQSGTEWTVTDIAEFTICNGCPQPLPSGIGVVDGAPVVVFTDAGAGAIRAATPVGDGWEVSDVEPAGLGIGLSFATDGAAAHVAYDTGDGAVRLASWDGAAWASVDVAEVPEAERTTGLGAPQTGVAVAADGSVWVTWQDDEGVHLAGGDGASLEAVETPGTEGGRTPSVAVADNGAVLLAWYDLDKANLGFGVYGEPEEVVVAMPSPAPTPSVAPDTGGECGADGELQLDIVAQNIAFDTACLVGPADEPFEINFSNQDAGVPHNVAIYTDVNATENLFQGETFNGVADQVYAVDPIAAGSYFFRCDVHPTMAGTFVAVEAGGGGGGGGGNG